MRRFACINFQITTTADSKLSYTPCYTQYGLLSRMLIRRKNKNFLKMWVGFGLKFNFKYLYIT